MNVREHTVTGVETQTDRQTDTQSDRHTDTDKYLAMNISTHSDRRRDRLHVGLFQQ